jgi:MgtC family protein
MLMFGHDDLVIIGRVLGALVIGAAIGFERTFHGRPAGFRTHALVCVASALLMIVTVYQGQWMTFVEHDAIRTDPTRMAQGIMTGIGFLGAGVIFKEGLTVRGLTTAASIWITSANRDTRRHRLLVCRYCWRSRYTDHPGIVSLHRSASAKRILCPPHAALRARSRDD